MVPGEQGFYCEQLGYTSVNTTFQHQTTNKSMSKRGYRGEFPQAVISAHDESPPLKSKVLHDEESTHVLRAPLLRSSNFSPAIQHSLRQLETVLT
jgi:hypothetical protein